jgi:hypothetical protein
MLQESSFMVASVSVLTFHFPVPTSLLDSFFLSPLSLGFYSASSSFASSLKWKFVQNPLITCLFRQRLQTPPLLTRSKLLYTFLVGGCLKDDSRITRAYSRRNYRGCTKQRTVPYFLCFRPTFSGLFAPSCHPGTEITLRLEDYTHNSVVLRKRELLQNFIEIR